MKNFKVGHLVAIVLAFGAGWLIGTQVGLPALPSKKEEAPEPNVDAEAIQSPPEPKTNFSGSNEQLFRSTTRSFAPKY